ncbi:hypothetical protein [Streptomyces sp. NPDC051576]|uniref:hypothetical protein n=1 Tax=Streptomyces sp. NPDC051576 TaxID=3155803 RepID=UPI003444B712
MNETETETGAAGSTGPGRHMVVLLYAEQFHRKPCRADPSIAQSVGDWENNEAGDVEMVSADGELGQPQRGTLERIRALQARIRSAMQQLRSLPEEGERRVERYAQERVEKLHALSSLDETVRSRIEATISATAREAHIGEGRMTTLREFRAQHRWMRWISNFLVAFILWWVLLVWAVSLPLAHLSPSDGSDATALAAVVFIFVISPFGKLLQRRNERYGALKSALVIVGFSALLALTRDWWIHEVLKLTADPAIQTWHPYDGRSTGGMEGGAMLAAMTKIWFRVSFLWFLIEGGKVMLLTAGTAAPSASASAVLVDSFLDVAWRLEDVAGRIRRDPGEGESLINAYEYLSSPERKQLVDQLESTARFVEGHWYKTARLKDHTVNIEVRRIADGIAASVRRWKPVLAVGGQEGLEEMRGAFALAVLNAADGEWGQLASDVSARELFSRRLFKVLRRMLALFVLAVAVVLVFVRPFSWSESMGNYAVAAPFMVAAALLAGFVDPTIYDRMGPVTKLGAELLPKR